MKIYVANFSLGLDATTDLPFVTGHCTAVLRAPNLTQALDRFRALLHRAKTDDESFTSVRRVYMDACTEFKSASQLGVITYLQLNDTEGGSVTTSSIAGGDHADIESYGFGNDESKPDAADEPFVDFTI